MTYSSVIKYEILYACFFTRVRKTKDYKSLYKTYNNHVLSAMKLLYTSPIFTTSLGLKAEVWWDSDEDRTPSVFSTTFSSHTKDEEIKKYIDNRCLSTMHSNNLFTWDWNNKIFKVKDQSYLVKLTSKNELKSSRLFKG